jgi:hypothetical protein
MYSNYSRVDTKFCHFAKLRVSFAKRCEILPKFRVAIFVYNLLESGSFNLMCSVEYFHVCEVRKKIWRTRNFGKFSQITRNSAKFHRYFAKFRIAKFRIHSKWNWKSSHDIKLFWKDCTRLYITVHCSGLAKITQDIVTLSQETRHILNPVGPLKNFVCHKAAFLNR